jgi:chromate transporter
MLFLRDDPPTWAQAAGAGAGAAVAAVAVQTGISLIPAGWRRAPRHSNRIRWTLYLTVGAVAAATVGPWLVLLLIFCGVAEIIGQRVLAAPPRHPTPGRPVLAAAGFSGGVLLSIAWVAINVGALSYGGGFVIIPLMRSDAVDHYHWMTGAQFLNAVALGQITPGPVVQTVAVVGYAAAGIAGGLLAAAVAFSPSFAFILLGAHRFDQLRGNHTVRAFLDGAGPAAIGAIFGSAVPLALTLTHTWQFCVLAGAAVLLLVLRRGPVLTLLTAATAGVLVVLTGGALPQ